MAGTYISFGRAYNFTVEFPDLSEVLREHERNYLLYAAKHHAYQARYMPSSTKELQPIGNEHRIRSVLVEGGFGTVYRVVKISDGQELALKWLKGAGYYEKREVNVMSQLRHEHIIGYESAFEDPFTKQICIVMELAFNDLATQIKTIPETDLSLDCIRSICWQAFSGLNYLHERGYKHRDMKPMNILVTNWDSQAEIVTIKLGDFGLAGDGSDNNGTICGTPNYEAPEIDAARIAFHAAKRDNKRLVPQPLTSAVDVWALGKIIEELIDMRRDHEPPRHALDLICKMMAYDAAERPSAAECLGHPWMASVQRPKDLLAQKRAKSPNQESSSSSSPAGQRRRTKQVVPARNLYRDILDIVSEKPHQKTAQTEHAPTMFADELLGRLSVLDGPVPDHQESYDSSSKSLMHRFVVAEDSHRDPAVLKEPESDGQGTFNTTFQDPTTGTITFEEFPQQPPTSREPESYQPGSISSLLDCSMPRTGTVQVGPTTRNDSMFYHPGLSNSVHKVTIPSQGAGNDTMSGGKQFNMSASNSEASVNNQGVTFPDGYEYDYSGYLG